MDSHNSAMKYNSSFNLINFEVGADWIEFNFWMQI